MQITPDFSLKNHNTFGIDAKAEFFVSVQTVEELTHALNLPGYSQKFILGGGSNMLLKKNIKGLVINLNLKGITVEEEDENHVWLRAAAGENWHEFVMYCVGNNYGGVENLALIPGNVGTSPVQNIGAYGVELKDSFESCEVVDRTTLETRTLSKAACNFGYRDSIFKNEDKGRYIITSVLFKLTKRDHELRTSYGAIQQTLDALGIDEPTLVDIANAVIYIRQQKLPDPKKIGNSGSFFKNPVVARNYLGTIQKNHPDAPFYEMGDDLVKIPAGWLIERAGFKGKRFGQAGVHDRQALVLVNHGGATGDEVWKVALEVQQAVQKEFGILLQPEVNIIE
ncbi:UDP-N-acetylmuramate dehydrogenase [Flavimarina sp. Hel_I_48]|uniref:UDP-N-acetylmuramate dehydrogenase n=1 Tax=Flavimarina sp. Hel_I_48 TaxID=1392488 RepID=UPI0004DF95E6|nr:UDP-N-acetylmuramate dehydrogenase [Flavimarina sp. Hel_I_48]